MIRPMKQTDPQFKLRLPANLKERLDQAAGEHEKTLTAEIVARLEKSFDPSMPIQDASFLLAKWSNDLTGLEADNIQLKLRAGESAVALLCAVDAIEKKSKVPQDELNRWAKDAKALYDDAVATMADAAGIVAKVQAAAAQLRLAAKRQGIIAPEQSTKGIP